MYLTTLKDLYKKCYCDDLSWIKASRRRCYAFNETRTWYWSKKTFSVVLYYYMYLLSLLPLFQVGTTTHSSNRSLHYASWLHSIPMQKTTSGNRMCTPSTSPIQQPSLKSWRKLHTKRWTFAFYGIIHGDRGSGGRWACWIELSSCYLIETFPCIDIPGYKIPLVIVHNMWMSHLHNIWCSTCFQAHAHSGMITVLLGEKCVFPNSTGLPLAGKVFLIMLWSSLSNVDFRMFFWLQIRPHLPFEYTYEGMLERVFALVKYQDFCTPTTPHESMWPPLSAKQVFLGEPNEACAEVCFKKGEHFLCIHSYQP